MYEPVRERCFYSERWIQPHDLLAKKREEAYDKVYKHLFIQGSEQKKSYLYAEGICALPAENHWVIHST